MYRAMFNDIPFIINKLEGEKGLNIPTRLNIEAQFFKTEDIEKVHKSTRISEDRSIIKVMFDDNSEKEYKGFVQTFEYSLNYGILNSSFKFVLVGDEKPEKARTINMVDKQYLLVPFGDKIVDFQPTCETCKYCHEFDDGIGCDYKHIRVSKEDRACPSYNKDYPELQKTELVPIEKMGILMRIKVFLRRIFHRKQKVVKEEEPDNNDWVKVQYTGNPQAPFVSMEDTSPKTKFQVGQAVTYSMETGFIKPIGLDCESSIEKPIDPLFIQKILPHGYVNLMSSSGRPILAKIEDYDGSFDIPEKESKPVESFIDALDQSFKNWEQNRKGEKKA